MRAALLALLLLLASGAQAQMPDPFTAAIVQEWQASETSRGHFAEAMQKLVQAYVAAQQKQAAVDAYWKDYVAGLTKDTKTGSN